ncbi:glutaredoxin family protein [Lysinibacillus sp. NPDC093712]|uniref:glutaredoxin family protein n=1 Tax=Lysinibacillus sp. NPDC093712 TaxID=3390579 RepID=UPI003D0373C4
MKLYTQNVCPKCMLVKFIIEQAGKESQVEYINLDENEGIREELKGKGFQSLPILEFNDEYYINQTEITKIINS